MKESLNGEISVNKKQQLALKSLIKYYIIYTRELDHHLKIWKLDQLKFLLRKEIIEILN
jgi:hypothetical protein